MARASIFTAEFLSLLLRFALLLKRTYRARFYCKREVVVINIRFEQLHHYDDCRYWVIRAILVISLSEPSQDSATFNHTQHVVLPFGIFTICHFCIAIAQVI